MATAPDSSSQADVVGPVQHLSLGPIATQGHLPFCRKCHTRISSGQHFCRLCVAANEKKPHAHNKTYVRFKNAFARKKQHRRSQRSPRSSCPRCQTGEKFRFLPVQTLFDRLLWWLGYRPILCVCCLRKFHAWPYKIKSEQRQQLKPATTRGGGSNR
jgi:hypothetical protein